MVASALLGRLSDGGKWMGMKSISGAKEGGRFGNLRMFLGVERKEMW